VIQNLRRRAKATFDEQAAAPLLTKFRANDTWLFPSLIPGISLHEELRLFVQAGFTPLEALRAATLDPARFLGRDRDFGTVERGKVADLVLLDADPLADIRNTRKINAVVLNGRLLDRKSLDAVLASLEQSAANGQWRVRSAAA
jgi:adenine deaminase